MRSAAACAIGLLAVASRSVASRDVPKGYCHNCEVTCFEDCAMKYDREITVPDVTGKATSSKKATAVEAHMKKKLYGVVSLGQVGEGPSKNRTEALMESFQTCLRQDECSCAGDAAAKRKVSMLAQRGGQRRCAVGNRPCAVGCAKKALPAPALLQQSQSVKPGPSDPEDAAIPWSLSVHPVKINSFATGRQDLEQCFKSCLAATCGCEDAPGMEAIDDLMSAVKANDMVKDPVEDTHPMFQYKHAPIEECGKGMHGKKVTKGLYADLEGGPEGWVEVCSADFFKAMGKAPDVEMKNCQSSKALLAGCLWDEVKNECVYGLKKLIRCYSRYTDDDKF